MLALHQGGEAPAGDAAVELDAVGIRETLPEACAVDVDEIVRDQPAIALKRHRPVDVAGGVPLIGLGLLVEPAQVRLVAAVVVAEMCGVTRLDLVPVVHNVPPCRFRTNVRIKTGFVQPEPQRQRAPRPAVQGRRQAWPAKWTTRANATMLDQGRS